MKPTLSQKDRDLIRDWAAATFGPDAHGVKRPRVPHAIADFFGDADGQAPRRRARTPAARDTSLARVSGARPSPDAWPAAPLEGKERSATLTDEEVKRLVDWLGRVRGTTPNP